MRRVALWLVLALATAAAVMAADTLSLTEFVALAVERDPTFHTARLEASLAPGRLDLTRSDYRPKVVPFYGLSRPGPSSIHETYGVNVTWDTGWGVDLTAFAVDARVKVQEDYLDYGTRDYGLQIGLPIGRDFGRLPAETRLETARADARRARRELADGRRRAMLEAIHAYYGHLQAASALTVSRTALDRARRSAEVTRVKYELGDASRLDLDRSRHTEQQAEIAVLQAETRLARVRQEIAATYHIDARHQVAFRLPDLGRLRLPWTTEQAVALTLERDTGILTARDRVDLAELRLTAARRNLLPDLDLAWRVGRREESQAGIDGGEESYQELYLSSDLSLGIAERRHAIRTARVELSTRQIALGQLEDALRAQVTSDLDGFSRMARLLVLGEASVDTTRSQVEVAGARFERGLGPADAMLDAQARLEAAEHQLLATRVELVLAYYRILFRLHELELDRLVP